MIRVVFAGKKLQRECESATIRGPIIGRKVALRILQLCASENLQAFRDSMQHAHLHKLEPLKKGRYAVDLTGNYRLVFVPIDDRDEDINPDDLSQVTAIRILSVEDYH